PAASQGRCFGRRTIPDRRPLRCPKRATLPDWSQAPNPSWGKAPRQPARAKSFPRSHSVYRSKIARHARHRNHPRTRKAKWPLRATAPSSSVSALREVGGSSSEDGIPFAKQSPITRRFGNAIKHGIAEQLLSTVALDGSQGQIVTGLRC